VHRAYRDLEQAGVVAGRPGIGTFVVATTSPGATPEQLRELSVELRRWVDRARGAGLDEEGIAALIAATMDVGPDIFSGAQ